jgi:hypothetical protein
MKRGLAAGLAAAVVFGWITWASVAPVEGQAARSVKAFAPPVTPWGDPDLQGVFTNNNENGIPFERPENVQAQRNEDVSAEELERLRDERESRRVAAAPNLGVLPGSNPVHWFEHFGAANSRAWLVVDPPDGRIPPLTAEAQRRPRARGGSSFGNGPFNSTLDFSLYDRCISRGMPGSMLPGIYGNAYAIVQAPGYVSIMYEMIHEARVIPLDGRASLPSSIRSYMGDARGHFEGNTLVVETRNFVEGSAYRGASADTLRIIERFTPIAADKLEWAVRVDDPSTWTRPWTFAMELTRGGAEVQPFEYACHEGNYGMPNMLSAARAAEKAGEGR